MFCPKCRSEYREGYYRCAVCNIDLVDELSPEQGPEYIEYEYFNAEHFMYVRPLAEPARLMVKKDQVEIAKTLLKDLSFAITGINLNDNDDENVN